MQKASSELSLVRAAPIFTFRRTGKSKPKTGVRNYFVVAELGLKHVFALTYKPHFFERLGFRIIDKQQLPHKVWSICIDCLKFPVCDEVAMQIEVEEWTKKRATSEVK